MAVDVVGRDVGEHGHIRHEAGREIDLVGRNFQHIDRAAVRRRQIEHGLADIAADLGREACGGKNVADQRRRRRFAVGAGDGDERRAAGLRASAGARGRTIRYRRSLRRRPCARRRRFVRFGMRQRHAGAEDQRGDLGPTAIAQNGRIVAPAARQRARRFVVVPGDDTSAPPAFSDATDEMPDRASPKTATSPAKERAGIISTSASGWKGRPARARRDDPETDHDGGSVQPSCSK
jgi:hypothetical protein